MEQDRPPNSKAKLTEVNSYLTCYLCKGYYIDATTIVECLHSFCRSCIIKYLQQDPFCPICDLMINMAKPQIKPDKTLQDIVYKLVPGLYASEMCRRRKFWAEHPEEAQTVACPESRGLMTERIIFSPQDAISLSIEYTSDEQTAWNHSQQIQLKSQKQLTNENSNISEPDPEIPLRRYLQCPAMLRVEHLKKFICNKYNVDNQQYHIDILYKRVPLPDHYTLMDIAYIYSWKRNEPMKFFFRITDIALAPERFDYFEPSLASSTSTPKPAATPISRTPKQHINNNNNNNIIKKPSGLQQEINKNIEKISDNNKTDAEVKLNKNCDKVKPKMDKHKVELIKENDDKIDVLKDSVKSVKNETVNNNNKTCSESDNSDKQIKENKEVIKCEIKKEIKIEKIESDDIKTSDILNSTITASNVPEIPEIKKPILSNSDEDIEKSQFLKSIQLTARSSLSPPQPKPVTPIPKFIPPFPKPPLTQKRKYIRKSPKEPAAKKIKLSETTPTKKSDKSKISEALTKMRKIAPKSQKDQNKDAENDSKLKIRNIKNPIVRMMVSNMNKQSSSLNKIVGQTNNSNLNETERLKSLIDSCKLNIPSSLSITLTESTRNEDGTIVESKPTPIKPVQNYIEILKLPDANLPSPKSETTLKSPENSTENQVKLENGEKSPNSSQTQKNLQSDKNAQSLNAKNQKQTFQTMFEEAIKRNENMKAQLYQIQNQAKNAELAKKAANNVKNPTKKQQNNALDLSSKTSPVKIEKPEISPPLLFVNTPPPSSVTSSSNQPEKSPNSNQKPVVSSIPTTPTTTTTASPNLNVNGKRNILEIAHQLSKRSKLESESPNLKSPTAVSTTSQPKTSPKVTTPKSSPQIKDSETKLLNSPPKQIIINNNFSSGGSISIKDSPKKNSPPIAKLPIPRLPVQKVPTPKLTMPIRNSNGLLKFSNYTAKLANSTTSVNTTQTTSKPNNTNLIVSNATQPSNSTIKSETIHGLTPNQILEKYNITNLAQFNANLNQAQLAFQQALMVSHQLEMHRFQNSQKQWINNPNILAHYENYVQTLKQQNQLCGNASKN